MTDQSTTPTQATTTQPPQAPTSAAPAAPDWKASIPEEIKSAPYFKTVDSVETLARNYANAQKLIGANKVAIPGDKATDDDWSKVWDTLGRPKDGTGYKIERPKDVTIPLDEGSEKAFRDMAHKAGLTQRQMQSIFGDYMQFAQKSMNTLEEMSASLRDQSIAELKKDWGREYDANLKRVQETAPRIFNEAEIESLKKKGLADDPSFIRAVHKMAVAMGEDKIDGKPVGQGLTPADAQRKANEIIGDTKGPYWNGSHPAHKETVAEVARLFEIAAS
jgi:hypothetical protein